MYSVHEPDTNERVFCSFYRWKIIQSGPSANMQRFKLPGSIHMGGNRFSVNIFRFCWWFNHPKVLTQGKYSWTIRCLILICLGKCWVKDSVGQFLYNSWWLYFSRCAVDGEKMPAFIHCCPLSRSGRKKLWRLNATCGQLCQVSSFYLFILHG